MDIKVFTISVLALCYLSGEASAAIGNSGWNSAPETQYHIQTDEGDERYFRYQTTSGQYRKEKRLQDGTVIGTSGWVDPNGMLRLNDYIADDKGYRILRTKMVYVGNTEDVGKGVSKAKHVPAQAGTLVSQLVQTPTVLKTIESSTVQPFYNNPSTAQPYYNPSTAQPYYNPSTVRPFYNPSTIASVTPASTYNLVTPVAVKAAPSVTPIAVNVDYPASTPSYASNDIAPKFDTSYQYPTPEANVNAIGVVYSNQDSAIPEKRYNPYTNLYANTQNRPAYPLLADRSSESSQNYETPYRRPYRPSHTDFGQKSSYVNNYDHPVKSVDQYDTSYNKNAAFPAIPEGYGNKLPTYDGISTTKDGFRYILPRQYHEEISDPSGDTRTGSFGYIDPFGIRRVTYYNTNPGSGFIHRKNNRYVGFNATPYDPRF